MQVYRKIRGVTFGWETKKKLKWENSCERGWGLGCAWSLLSAVALGEVGWHLRRKVSGDSDETEVEEGKARVSVGWSPMNPPGPSRPSDVGNSGGPGPESLARIEGK